METFLLILVFILAVVYLTVLFDKSQRAARVTRRELQELERLTKSLSEYRLVTIEQVQGLWLVYNSVSGSFVGQANDREGVVGVVKQFWPDKIVLAMDRQQDEVFLVHAPAGAVVPADEIPLVDISDR